MHIPNQPTDTEKEAYFNHHQRWLTFFSLLSFIGVFVSSWRYFAVDERLYIFYPFLFFTALYYGISLYVQGFGKKFLVESHTDVVRGWSPNERHSVDIFLPTCGEEYDIVKNTWNAVSFLKKTYQGKVTVYCLDDGADTRLETLARELGFTYMPRENRMFFKKSGNLHHGYQNSQSEFIAIFDADFCPRADFLHELLPYFDKNPRLGIVQSPQFFDVHEQQNWLERGAGSVQEYFYRSIQQNRQSHGGAICVGSNAIYRRAALDANSGPTLIEHSEDVHTGFDLKTKGWELLYVPIVLAKGVCPHDIRSFFRQQYRWCKGSMSLLTSKKFWRAKISLRSRLCYFTGFFYYIHTAMLSIIAPLIPLSLLYLVPEEAHLVNYIILIPSFIYAFVIFPFWHRTRHGFEVMSVKMVYAWAHLFAVIDTIRGSGLEWHPTGSKSNASLHFRMFQSFLTLYSLPAALLWVGGAAWYLVHWDLWDFLPIFLTGILYLTALIRIIVMAYIPSSAQVIPPQLQATKSS